MRNYYKKWKSLALLCFLFAASIGSLQAQLVNTYSFSQNSGTFAPIVGTSILAAATDDDSSPLTDIGFTFNYNGVDYTQFAANSNGYIRMGALPTGTYTPISTPSPNSIAFMGRDGQTNQDVTYELSGTAPNQVLTIQFVQALTWQNMNDIVTAQIKLYESSNVVQIVYGSSIRAAAYIAQVGLVGATAAVYSNRTTTTNWATSTAGVAAGNTMTWNTTVYPANGQTYTWTPPPATPPTPFEVAGTPGCVTGTNLDVAGTPGTDISWYWQTTAAGTSLATLYSGPYTVLNNTTYYLRAYNTVTLAWSTSSSSFTVTSIPVATAPPAPIALLDPSCSPAGSSMTVAAAPAGYEYFWQGTTVNGVSTANNASTPFVYTATGTYYVSAYEAATQCWSNTVGTLVTVDTYVPTAPTVSTDNYNICSGATTLEVSTDALPTSGNVTLSFGTNLNSPGPATLFPITVPALPGGATITSAQLLVTSVNAINGSWRSEARVGLSGMFTLPATAMSAATSGGLITPDPIINLVAFPTTGGTLNLVLSESFDDGSFSVPNTIDATYGQVQLVINYTVPASTIAWYDAATAGNTVGAGSPFETVGTSVLSNPATFGTYEFYAGTTSGGCSSTTRTLVTVNVVDVNAVLTPVDATCNGANNGSFILGTVECGATPFTYSLDGGLTFGAIPTNLIAETYNVIIMDNTGLMSAPIEVIVNQPAPPANLLLVDANYFTADISWTTTGNEISWTVEYGPAGFTPGTGTEVTVFTNFTTLTNLEADTDYEFYVTADCGAGSVAAGPEAFSTNPGFFSYDNSCGPGFNDITTISTVESSNIADDGVLGVTMPFNFTYQGINTNLLTIGNNGHIVVGTTTGFAEFGGAVTGMQTGLYPFNDDLDTEDGSVYYTTVGTAPDRQFIVQWESRPHFPGVVGQSVTFQVVIEETTDEIYFIYEDVEFGGSQAFADFGANASIGAAGPLADIQVSLDDATYLTNNSCVHFYNALCPNPINVVTQLFQEEVIIDWSASLYGETDWTIIYGPTGFDPLTGGLGTFTYSTPSANILNLEQLTTYDFYIYSECMLDNLTSNGLLVTLTTLPWCNTPTLLGGTTEVDSLFTTWNWIEVSGAPNGGLTGFNLQYGNSGFDLYNGTLEVATGLDFADTIVNPTFLAGGVYEVYAQAVCGVDTSNYAGPFSFVMPLSNDTVCGAEMLNVDGTVYTFNNTGATASVGEGVITPTGSNPDGYNNTDLPVLTWGVPVIEGSTWYTFVAPPSGSMRFSGDDEGFFASQIAIYELTDCADFSTFELFAASDQTNEDITSKIAPNFTICGMTPGATYYIMHDAWSNGFGGLPLFGQYSIKMTEIVLNAGVLTDILNTCTGDTVNLFNGITGYDNGGVWTAENAAANTGVADSLFASAGLAYQLFDFEYRLTDGCAFDTTYAHVDVYPPSAAGEDGIIDVCRNEPFDLLSGLGGTADLGGTWYNPSDIAMTSSATTASNIPGQFNYNYVAGNGVCPNDSALVLVNVSSTCNYLDIEDIFFGTMSVMPNPSNGVFNITNTGSTEIFNFEVTDVEGRVILVKNAAINGTSVTKIDLTGKVTGLYMIRVFNDNAEKTFRVILQ